MSNEMEQELRMFWRLQQDAAIAKRQSPEMLREIVEELEALAEYTNWPQLREAVRREIASHAKNQPPLKLVPCVS